MYRTTKPQSKKDAAVVFHLPGMGNFKAGLISKIFVHSCPDPTNGTTMFEPFLLVNSYKELTNAEVPFDPYWRFLMLEAHLVKNEVEPFVIKASDIISHCATCAY